MLSSERAGGSFFLETLSWCKKTNVDVRQKMKFLRAYKTDYFVDWKNTRNF